MERESLEIVGGVEVADDIEKRVRTTGVRGLDYEKAQELGVFQRIANLLCVIHSTIMAAYRVYGGIDYLIEQINARKNEISREMNIFDKSFDRFINFWTKYYSSSANGREVTYETERLYHKIMDWMQMPESWQLGEKQRLERKNANIKVLMPDGKLLYFFKTETNKNTEETQDETWCVCRYDKDKCNQIVVNDNMDKASALMVAKRLSDDDKENLYLACIVRDVVDTHTDIIPFKVFRNNDVVGKATN